MYTFVYCGLCIIIWFNELNEPKFIMKGVEFLYGFVLQSGSQLLKYTATSGLGI
jgi:hypothetical protein